MTLEPVCIPVKKVGEGKFQTEILWESGKVDANRVASPGPTEGPMINAFPNFNFEFGEPNVIPPTQQFPPMQGGDSTHPLLGVTREAFKGVQDLHNPFGSEAVTDKHPPCSMECESGVSCSLPRIVSLAEHEVLAKYLWELFNIDEIDDKAQVFSTNLARYNAAMQLQKCLNEKGWKVKKKMFEWVTPLDEQGWPHTIIGKADFSRVLGVEWTSRGIQMAKYMYELATDMIERTMERELKEASGLLKGAKKHRVWLVESKQKQLAKHKKKMPIEDSSDNEESPVAKKKCKEGRGRGKGKAVVDTDEDEEDKDFDSDNLDGSE
ncbi:hypothetical protein K439DRAFT_1611818 [Ramaria rubella]|nr:hypothetical protein K439DRAFT_1611818 [Ramaria rubella]